jgi:hypothetical protein
MIVKIQAHVRRFLQRKKFHVMKNYAKSKSNLQPSNFQFDTNEVKNSAFEPSGMALVGSYLYIDIDIIENIRIGTGI